MKRFIIGTCKVLAWMFTGAVAMTVVLYTNDEVHELYEENRKELQELEDRA